MKSNKITACPSNPMKDKHEIANLGNGNQLTLNHVSYAASTTVGNRGGFNANATPLFLATIVVPAETIQVMEATVSATRINIDPGGNASINGNCNTQRTHPPRQSSTCAGPSNTPVGGAACVIMRGALCRALGVSNYVFADGHAKAHRPPWRR